MKECNCDLRTKLVGDGCAICNPEQALEYALGTIEDLKQERDELAAQVEVMRDAISDHIEYHETYTESGFVPQYLRDALSLTPSAALREIQARTLRDSAELKPRNALEAAALKHDGVSGFLNCRADRISKGEE